MATAIGLVGIRDMGTYSSQVTYAMGNFVYYQGSTFLSLQDSNLGHTPSNDGTYWKYLARGFESEEASLIEIIDTYGLLGTVGDNTNIQSLVDEIADTISNDVVTTSMLTQSGTVTSEKTTALDGVEKNPNKSGTLAAQISSLNDRLANYVPYYVREITINTSYTFAAYEAKNLSTDLEPLIPYDGYTAIQPLGGKGNGNIGLVINCGTSWAYNAANTSRTFNSVTFYMLYRKNI